MIYNSLSRQKKACNIRSFSIGITGSVRYGSVSEHSGSESEDASLMKLRAPALRHDYAELQAVLAKSALQLKRSEPESVGTYLSAAFNMPR